MNHSQYREHHSLVTGRQVVEELLHFLFLLLHIVGDGSGKVVVGVLPALPVRDVGLNAEQSAFRLSYRFISRNRHDVNRHHQVTVHIGKLRHHTVFDIGRIFTKKKDSPKTVSHLEIVLFKLHCVGADIVFEIVSFLSGLFDVKAEGRFLPDTEEVVNDTQPFVRFKFHALAAQPRKVSDEIRSDTSEVSAGVLNALFVNGNGHILILNDGVCAGRLVEKYLVVFSAVLIKRVASLINQERLFKVKAIEPSVVNGQLRCRSAVKRIEQLGVFKEHRLFVLTACHGIVNIRKLICLGILILADFENAIVVNRLYRNDILHSLRHDKLLFILFQKTC